MEPGTLVSAASGFLYFDPSQMHYAGESED
jgi:hypothetical protein